MTIRTKSPAGLDGVAAAETALSFIDGDRGELIIAGERVDDLALEVSFEGLDRAAAGRSPAASRSTKARPSAGRRSAGAGLPSACRPSSPQPKACAIIDGFRAAIAALRPVEGIPPEAALVGAMPVIAAALVRRLAGKDPVAPQAGLGHAADMLRMMRGEAPAAAEARALDVYLVTVSDHGMNASTFTGRVVASTRADLFMAVTAAYCALAGPLHGGAPGPVLDMLDAIGRRERIAPWVDAALARGDRLMGFGHRIYRVRDPRADVLRRAVESLGGRLADLGLAAEVEAYAREALARVRPGRKLDTNVEFYTAILLDALSIPRQAFTPVFATARAAGWTAHALEQQRTGRLLRPASAYVGERPV